MGKMGKMSECLRLRLPAIYVLHLSVQILVVDKDVRRSFVLGVRENVVGAIKGEE